MAHDEDPEARAARLRGFFDLVEHEPHPGQWKYHESSARFRIAVCGRRYGKTTMVAIERAADLCDVANPCRGWIVGPTYDLAEKEFRIIYDLLINKLQLPGDPEFGKYIKHGYSAQTGNMYITLPWGSHVEARSADKPSSLVGESLDWVIMSEAAKHRKETWERFIRPALTDKRGSADFATTPEGQNWIYDMWRVGQDPSNEETASWQFPSWENTKVFPLGRDDPEFVTIAQTTTPEYFAQEYGAEFSAFVGKIFPEWSEVTHVTDVPYDPALPNYMAIDWGYANPAAFIEFQVTPNDEIRIWREHYAALMTVPQHIETMKARKHPEGYRGIHMAFADAAAPGDVNLFAAKFPARVLAEAAMKDWSHGVQLVQQFLRLNETGHMLPDGAPERRPKLIVDRSCTATIREFSNYRAAREPTSGQDRMDKAFKKDDHAVDAIRYALMGIYRLGGRTSLRHVEEDTAADMAPRLTDPVIYTGTSKPNGTSRAVPAPRDDVADRAMFGRIALFGAFSAGEDDVDLTEDGDGTLFVAQRMVF